MARGDMLVTKAHIGGEVEILNRKEFEAVPMTLDFTNVATKNNGKLVVYAGTPIKNDGAPVLESPWRNAVGILLYDVYEDRPQGTVLTKAYVHKARAEANCGLTYNDQLIYALGMAGCRIRFEEPLMEF